MSDHRHKLADTRSDNNPTTGQTIALAGLVQSAYLVDQIAKTGSAAPESFNPSINSLFQFDADSPESIFGGIHGIDLGLRILSDILGGNNSSEYRNTIRYTLGMLYLQRKLSRNDALMSIIRSRLEHTSVKAEYFADTMQGVATSIASIYQDTVSTLKFRIQVSGSMQQLQNPHNAENIRALLLAGIRAAVLWRQMEGKYWHLLLSHQRLLRTARALLNQ